jgi:hypothetical protein
MCIYVCVSVCVCVCVCMHINEIISTFIKIFKCLSSFHLRLVPHMSDRFRIFKMSCCLSCMCGITFLRGFEEFGSSLKPFSVKALNQKLLFQKVNLLNGEIIKRTRESLANGLTLVTLCDSMYNIYIYV